MISSVISFMGSWETVQQQYRKEYDSLESALKNFLFGNIELAQSESRSHKRELWEKALYDEGWLVNEHAFFTTTGRKLPVRFIGPQNNGLSAQISFTNPDFLTRWLFTYTTLAVRNEVAAIPILLTPMREEIKEEQRSSMIRMSTFEYYKEQLEMLSPLSLNHPFLILGYSKQESLFDLEVTEIEQAEHIKKTDAKVIINKCIEFPPEYHQAGIGILNFFSTYLHKKYPDQDASVKIEQNGLNVRMIVESNDGNCDIVEHALHEYEQIMSGQESPAKFTQDERLILELRNEVRAAKFRLESQQDIIALQNDKLRKSESRIDNLLCLVGEGLKKEPQTINVEVNPLIQNCMSVSINHDISKSIGCLEELSEVLPKEDSLTLPITDLINSLETIENESEASSVRKSSAMTKFSRFLDKMVDTNSTVRKAIDATQQGFEIAVDIVDKYNKIASWCGLPNVPTFK